MFHLKEQQTSIKQEIIAGLTTFFTMVYIVVVNPVILANAGVPFDQVFTATIIASIVGTLWMALAANYPIAIAPGMGLNAYLAFHVVSASEGGITYATAFSAVFTAGVLFIILSLTPLRKQLIEAIPNNLKYGITTGIGLFIAFIGLRQAGIVAADESNLVTLGNLHSPGVILTLIGLLISVVLMVLNVSGALFIGMTATALIAFFTGQLHLPKGFMSLPHLPDGLIISNPFSAFGDVVHHGLYAVVFSFLLVTIFDTTGTMIGVAEQAGLMKNNKLPNVRKALLADSTATTVGAVFGTSPTTAFVESSAGVAAGGRTGLTALTVAVLFGVSMFFSPLVSALSGIAAITSPALIIVGSLMMRSVSNMNWKEMDEAFPAFLVILSMPLTSSISTGIALGFISYPIVKAARGKWREIHPLVIVFAILFFIQLFIL
ncbi:hypoxanthine/guanine permease PbuO [Bacillus vallismortis]|uniref:hypoxanthine/guanine permease PbuO n=1 Tax=Bacillus vallismortis TaxID=72361 RepID=UPI000EF4AA8F|nr:hypoxanthine/guanine permease PbuO [Bacillus vallismortis]MCI3985258.1 hypoxanthine/guanine permease PbuO [Bacillus vallismortis]